MKDSQTLLAECFEQQTYEREQGFKTQATQLIRNISSLQIQLKSLQDCIAQNQKSLRELQLVPFDAKAILE